VTYALDMTFTLSDLTPLQLFALYAIMFWPLVFFSGCFVGYRKCQKARALELIDKMARRDP
jgi:hypothetical protein